MPRPDSALTTPKERFLSAVVAHALTSGLRSSADFLRYFPAAVLMQALADHPARRARILEHTIGLKPGIGLRKSPESSGEDLQIALDEAETDADAVVALFDPDDKVRFLDGPRLWAFASDPGLVAKTVPVAAELAGVLQAHTVFALATALSEGLVSPDAIVNAISVESIVTHLPRDRVAAIIEDAIGRGRTGGTLNEDGLLASVGIESLCEHVPLGTVWEWVLGAKVAVPLGLGTDAQLFDEREAHPDASANHDVTAIVDPQETQPTAFPKRQRSQ